MRLRECLSVCGESHLGAFAVYFEYLRGTLRTAHSSSDKWSLCSVPLSLSLFSDLADLT